MLNVVDLFYNKKIEGGGQFDPPLRQPVSKPDVRLNRVKFLQNNDYYKINKIKL